MLLNVFTIIILSVQQFPSVVNLSYTADLFGGFLKPH